MHSYYSEHWIFNLVMKIQNIQKTGNFSNKWRHVALRGNWLFDEKVKTNKKNVKSKKKTT